MTTIHHEVTIDLGHVTEEIITLWLVSHGSWPESDISDRQATFLDALHQLCARQGWLLDANDDRDEPDRPVALWGDR